MTLGNTEHLIDAMITRRKSVLESKIKAYPANNFRASDIGECDRQMVYSVLNWRDKNLHDAGLQAIFDAGNKEEQNVKARLGYEIGFEFVEQQRPFEIKSRSGDVMVRGHIDGKVLYSGEAIPIEIKSMNENVFNGIRSLDDFQKKPLHRKYLRQMQMYLYGNGEEAGIFILSNFRTEKLIPVVLDYGECEQILQRIERNWEMVKKKEYPDHIEYNQQICGKCAFAHICLTEVKNEGAAFIEIPELEAKLERRAELEPLKEEYEALDEEVKAPFKEKEIPEAFVGKSWQIVTKVQTGTRVDTKAMPDEVKKPYIVPTRKVITTILKI